MYTENDLRKELAMLTETINKGEATVRQAERLAEVRKDLRKIDNAKHDKPW